MTRKISRVPRLSPDSGVNVVMLAMAADMPGMRESAEMMAEAAEELVALGENADALEWFSKIVGGGDPELAPHASLRIAGLLVDDDMEAAQAALRYAADHGSEEVAQFAAGNLEILAQHDVAPRSAPATVDEVLGRTAIGRGQLLSAEGDLDAATHALEQAAGSPLPDIAAQGLAYLGSTHSLRGDQDAAVEVLEQAVATGHPQFAPMAAIDLSGILVDRGDLDRATAVLRDAQSGQGWAAAMAGVNLGGLLANNLGDVEAGVAALRQAAARTDEPFAAAAARFNLGTVLEDHDDLVGAREAYEGAAELRQPRFSGLAAVNLGLMLSKQLDVHGAHAAYQLAAEIGDPDDAAKAGRLLEQLAQLGDLDDVHARAQTIDLNDPGVVGESANAAGEQFLRDGDLQSALRAFEKAMDTGHPIHAPEGAAWVALAFEQAEGLNGAQTAIGRLDEIGHAELIPRAWFFFASRLMGGGRLQDADDLWAQLSEPAGGDVQAAAECGRHILRGSVAEAEASFQRVLETTPDLAGQVGSLALALGDIYRGDDDAAARASYELACVLADRSGLTWLIDQARDAAAGA